MALSLPGILYRVIYAVFCFTISLMPLFILQKPATVSCFNWNKYIKISNQFKTILGYQAANKELHLPQYEQRIHIIIYRNQTIKHDLHSNSFYALLLTGLL